MALCARFFSLILGQERPWSAKLFFLFLGLYFLLILFLALPEGRSTLLGPELPNPLCAAISTEKSAIKNCDPVLRITARSTANDYLQVLGGSDPASYARGGLLLAGKEWGGPSYTIDLSMFERLKQMCLIGFGMWPPGMFVLNAVPIMVSVDAPLGLYQIVTSSALWSVALALIASLLMLHIRLWLAVILPTLLLFFPLLHDYFIRYGVMYSETYCAAFMVIGFSLLAVYYSRKTSNGLMFVAGICFAIASFFRGQMLPVAVGVSVVLLWIYLKRMWHLKPKNRKEIIIQPLTLGTLLFFIGFYSPIGMYMKFNRGALFHASYVWELPFSTSAFPDAGVANFLALGGMRAACEADMTRCEALRKVIKPGATLPKAKVEVLKSFIYHPLNFSRYKLPIAWKFWNDGSGPGPIIYKWDNIFMFVLLISCLGFMVMRKLWLFLGLTIATMALLFGPPFLLHFEVRYFYLTKAFILFLPFWLLIVG
jgi:hypothetical protein